MEKGTPVNEAIEETLKGKEIKMSEGLFLQYNSKSDLRESLFQLIYSLISNEVKFK